jgi:predicted  nucleic acid-binding Zn-ribbon protein
MGVILKNQIETLELKNVSRIKTRIQDINSRIDQTEGSISLKTDNLKMHS